jgi:hypothetical protein
MACAVPPSACPAASSCRWHSTNANHSLYGLTHPTTREEVDVVEVVSRKEEEVEEGLCVYNSAGVMHRRRAWESRAGGSGSVGRLISI